jgi:uncharacterized RDD family membrane protein YckC
MIAEAEGRVTFRTPEHLRFSLDLAGPSVRFIACLIDLGVISVTNSILASVLGILGAFSQNLAGAVITILYFAVSVGYAMVMEWFYRGQTVGKRLMRLRVLDAQGLRLRPWQVILRNLFRPLDLLPAFYLVGGIACLLSPKGQRLGDRVAGTIVVRNPDPGRPDLEKVLAGKFNSFLAYRHLAARLRQQVSPQEASLAFQALLRRDEFGDADRVTLFADLKSCFAERVPFPQEVVEGLPDEQYIRNVVEILYR